MHYLKIKKTGWFPGEITECFLNINIDGTLFLCEAIVVCIHGHWGIMESATNGVFNKNDKVAYTIEDDEVEDTIVLARLCHHRSDITLCIKSINH